MAHRVYKIPEFDIEEKYIISEESCTIPDQSLTITQILNRCANGMPPPDIVQNPSYDDPELLDHMLENDLVSPEMKQNKDLSDYGTYTDELNGLTKRIEESQARTQDSSDTTQVCSPSEI